MGGGKWDTDRYTSDKTSRSTSGTPDFAYTTTSKARHSVHDNLDPMRINKKPFGKLESRDSDEHPESNAVFVCFDVTGSNIQNATEAQKRLPNLMGLLGKYIKDPQVLVAANDDFTVEPARCVQVSDFESDNRIDEHIRNIVLVSNGGGNDGESYNLLMYAAARKTVLDCMEKRNRKGYFFMYADEPIYSVMRHGVDPIEPYVGKDQVKAIFGDTLQANIPIAEIIEELKRTYHVFIIWPGGHAHGYDHAREQYVKLFGEESVLTLQHPNLICEMIGSVIGLNEEQVTPSNLVKDLLAVGTGESDAKEVSHALAHYAKSRSEGELPAKKGTRSARL